jgi:hypothetical protein
VSIPQVSLRTTLLRAAARVLLAVDERAPTDAPVAETVSDDRWEVVVVVTARKPASPLPGQVPAPSPVPITGETAALIRAELARIGRPVKITVLAARLKREPTNYFREVVRRMKAQGEVIACPGDTYWLAARVFPAGQ